MSNIVQRNLHRSLAISLIAVEEETGISQEKLVKLMNDEFGYVDKDTPSAVSILEQQMELEVAAERHAKKNKVKVSETAVGLTAIKRKMGTLASGFQESNPDPKTT
jgi:hypothetical protein